MNTLIPVRAPASGAPPLVLEVFDEPRVRDVTLAERLGFERPRKIRDLIERNRAELETYGALVARKGSPHDGANPKGGRPGTTYYLNEGQSLVVCALSRTPVAAAVRREVIRVFMAYRRGELPFEARALRDICELAHVFRPPGEPHHYLLAPVTSSILDALAAFQTTDEDNEDDLEDDEHDGREPDDVDEDDDGI